MYEDLDAKDSTKEEARETTRFRREPGTEFASITKPQELARFVQVSDESLGGIGILTGDREGFRIGLTIEIVYAGATFAGVVKHITRRADDSFVVGIEQTD